MGMPGLPLDNRQTDKHDGAWLSAGLWSSSAKRRVVAVLATMVTPVLGGCSAGDVDAMCGHW